MLKIKHQAKLETPTNKLEYAVLKITITEINQTGLRTNLKAQHFIAFTILVRDFFSFEFWKW